MNPKNIEESISKKTKIIMPTHYAGLPCKIDEIRRISKKNKITLIEDAAESIGSKINKQKVGTFGEIAIFSFAGNKILTSGEGGAVVTDSKEKFEKLKLIRSHGRKTIKNYFSNIQTPQYVELGYNWRMSSITAALCLSQLNKIEKLISLRRQNAKYYQKKLAKIEGIKIHTGPKGYKHVYQLFSIQLPSKRIRDGLSRFLAKKGIMSKVFFEPIHLTKHFSNYKIKQKKLKVTETVSERILSLPMYPELTKEEINEITGSISEFLEKL
jgi:perosamine synthetase